MNGIKLFLFLILCSEDALSCRQMATSHLAFDTPAECQEQLTRLVAAFADVDAGHPWAMGRCRYLVGAPQEEITTAGRL